MPKETSISAQRPRPGSEAGRQDPTTLSAGSSLATPSRISSPGGERGRSPEPGPKKSCNTAVSQKRCPSPNSLARLDPKPPRLLAVSKTDFLAFKEMLGQHKMNMIMQMVGKGVIKKEHIRWCDYLSIWRSAKLIVTCLIFLMSTKWNIRIGNQQYFVVEHLRIRQKLLHVA